MPGVIAAYFWTKRLAKNKCDASDLKPLNIEDEHTVQLPSPFHSFLPIAVPLLLISMNSLVNILWPDSSSYIVGILAFAGQPIMALSIGVALSLSLIKIKGIKILNDIFESAIEKAGPILILTAAGGMFGNVIKETGIGIEAGKILSETGLGLVIPFLIACLMKTAQGSSTVAIITAASFMAPMLHLMGLESEWGRLLTMLAMGSGSMMISHANDSYFWVVTRFSDIQPDDTLRFFSTATAIMGITIFFLVWMVSLFVI
jgi:GntP family gluconate:H+ symporter